MRNDSVNRYTGQVKRSDSQIVEYAPSPNPYIAIVRNHLDSSFMGGLEVQLMPKNASGNPPDDPGSYYKVRYLAPFYGVTPLAGIQKNSGHEYSQKSYGMWFIPPDVGSKVLVIFAEGGEAFWIGCIPEQGTNFMCPSGDAVTTYHTATSLPNEKLPVGEINKKERRDASTPPTAFLKPVNTDILSSLTTRGLVTDETRGLTTSSARREVPSAVFGISTPGPHDRRPDAPKVAYGNTEVYHNRLGGSSLVMDDGDATLTRKGAPDSTPPEYADKKAGDEDGDVTIPHNEMLRLKTRTGHQILMHNSEDLIYIGNSRGTAWIELTSNGKIDIYSEDSISVRTAQDLNFKADRDINFQADRDFNVKAKKNITFEAEQEDFQLIVGRNNQITTGGYLHLNTDKDTRIKSNTSYIDILAHTTLDLESATESTNILANTTLNLESATESTNILANTTLNLESANDSINILANTTLNLESATESTNILSEKNNNFTTTTGDTSIKSGGYYLASTGETYHMNDGSAPPRNAASSASAASAASATPATKAIALTVWSVARGETETIMRRVPAREPWLSHENLAPLNFTPDETDIKKTIKPRTESSETDLTRFNRDQQRVEGYNGIDWVELEGENEELFITQTPPVEGEYKFTPDTFKRGT